MSTVLVHVDTATLARAMFVGGDLQLFNSGCYEGTSIPLRKMTGTERVVIAGTTAEAKVLTSETWIADRFGPLGARQVRRLIGR